MEAIMRKSNTSICLKPGTVSIQKVIIFIHGGGWSGGDKMNFNFARDKLVSPYFAQKRKESTRVRRNGRFIVVIPPGSKNSNHFFIPCAL